MKRTVKRKPKNMESPAAILTGDWHLREDTPFCRTDDYWKAQWDKVDFISNLQVKYQCPVIHSGDLFNHWKPSPYLLTKTIEHLPKNFMTVFGNHDLPQNNIEMRERSGIEVLSKAGVLEVLSGYHWNQKLPELPNFDNTEQGILVWHIMVWQGESPWPNSTDPEASALLKDTQGPALILTGHNHKPFVVHNKDRLLVNPGSIMRMSADQINHKPRVYLWYQESNTVEAVYLPIDEDGVSAVSRKHLEQVKEKDERIEAFIEKLDMDWSSEVSFRKNLEQFFKSNPIANNVERLVWDSLEGK